MQNNIINSFPNPLLFTLESQNKDFDDLSEEVSNVGVEKRNNILVEAAHRVQTKCLILLNEFVDTPNLTTLPTY